MVGTKKCHRSSSSVTLHVVNCGIFDVPCSKFRPAFINYKLHPFETLKKNFTPSITQKKKLHPFLFFALHILEIMTIGYSPLDPIFFNSKITSRFEL